jgi:GNAT superfamily N-acetyltransferase
MTSSHPPAFRISVRQCQTARDYAAMSELFRLYSEWLAAHAGLSDAERAPLERERLDVRTAYAAPHGPCLLARLNEQAAGCVALRQTGQPRIAEIKRFFVTSAARGSGIGSALLARTLRVARARGYRAVRLDSLPVMSAALRLYARLGFEEIGPYDGEHPGGALYFERRL